jgi:tetratricopeptide (TPR) repeat protein
LKLLSRDLLFVKFRKTNQCRCALGAHFVRCCAVAIVLLALLNWPCRGQGSSQNAAGQAQAQPSGGRGLSEAAVELQKRLDAVQGAKALGDPARVAHASEQVIALALRELGQVRLLESAYGQAAELYGRSLDFENIPDTRVDLAVAHFQAGQVDKAIAEADQALLDDPNDVRAFQLLGRAWTSKNDNVRASRALARAAEISPSIGTLYSLALSQLATKDAAGRKAADQTFAQMMKVAGDSGSLHVMFGRAYRDAGDMPAAIGEFEKAIRLDTRTPHAHYFLGLAHLAANEWAPTPEVREEFLKELQFNPHDYLANYMMGFIDSSQRNYEEANKYLKQAATLNPQAPDPWLYLGLNAYAQNDMNLAETSFRKAIELTGADDARSNYQIRRAYIDLGRILSTSGRKEEAEKYLDKARELQNKVLQTSQQHMASHYAEEGADPSASAAVVASTDVEKGQLGLGETETVDPFAEADPNAIARANLSDDEKRQAAEQEKQLREVLAEGFSDLATSEAIRKDYASAMGHYQEAEHWDPAAPGLMRNLGVAAFRAQAYPEAIRGLSAQLAVHSEDDPARAMLGMAYVAQEKYKDAVKTFAPLGQKGMQDASVGYAWALALTRLGELPRATEVLEEFQKQDRPNDMQMLEGQLWIEIGDYSRAVQTFHGVLQNDPSFPKAHYFAGEACIRWEHWDQAAQEFQAELALVPNDPDAKFDLGFVYVHQSRVDEAAKLFQEVMAESPEHSSAQYEYGKILLDRGDIQGAITHLEIAARLSPQTDYVHYQLQAAYRKDGRIADADRELEIYKKIKAKQRERASTAISSPTP